MFTIDLWQDYGHQTGYTDLGNNWIGILCNCPQPTEQNPDLPKLWANKIYKELDMTNYLNEKRPLPTSTVLTLNLNNNVPNYITVNPSDYNVNYFDKVKYKVNIPIPNITQISNYPITQNGTQTIPIPSGYDAVNSIGLNVQVKPELKYITNNNVIRNRTQIVNTGRNFSWNVGDTLILITEDSTFYQISFLYMSTISYTQTVQRKTWVWKFSTNANVVNFLDKNSNVVFSMTNEDSDTNSQGLVLSKQFFNLSLLQN